MSPFLLRIIFHGLIAFVPQTPQQPGGHNMLTALVLDGQSVPKNASGCVATHHATISFTYQDAPSCFDNGCKFNNNECSCEITHSKNILLDPEPDPGSVPQTPQLPLTPPANPVPQSGAEADNFSYVMNLQTNQTDQTGLHLRPGLLDGPLPADLLARMNFAYTTLHACDLASQPENGADVVRAYVLTRIASPLTGPETAVAQRVVADTTITPNDPKNPNNVTLTLQDNTGAARSFKLSPQGQCDGTTPCVLISINSDRDPNPAAECNDGVARDFAFFYGLVQAPPQWEARFLPVADRSPGAFKGVPGNLVPPVCGTTQHGQNSRPICGMAVINP